MSDQSIRRQLRVIRDLADNLLELLGEEDEEPPEACKHPKEKRRPAGVMGDPDRFFCMDCQTMVTTVTADAAPTPVAEG